MCRQPFYCLCFVAFVLFTMIFNTIVESHALGPIFTKNESYVYFAYLSAIPIIARYFGSFPGSALPRGMPPTSPSREQGCPQHHCHIFDR